MQLPPLPSAEQARAMAAADGLLDKYNPDWEDEPQVPAGNSDGGQWTDEDAGADDTANIEPAAARVDATQAKKERFVDAHLADAQTAADQLGLPVENILGLSVLESQWGESRFARQGNNYFGIHYPASRALRDRILARQTESRKGRHVRELRRQPSVVRSNLRLPRARCQRPE